MPRSKRFQKVSLTQTKKKGLGMKQELVQTIRDCAGEYSHIYLFSVQNMRNAQLKQVRNKWKHSRFFLGKNRVMALALGRGAEDEVKENVSEISKRLRGQCGLLFSNEPKETILKFFEDYRESDYARAGNKATETVTLQPGPLKQFAFSMEPFLRQLGLPTTLQRGIIQLLREHTVCQEGATLTPEQARLLKLLGIHMAEFKVTVEAVWNDGEFEELVSSSDRLNTLGGEEEDKEDDDDDEEMSD
uniref:Ribosome assembly factor mrt4 n=1 Tax=Lynceus sp. MCZ IZ 141354 TaxID=1930659 RepID=A0A9N6WUB8_9CRUS|nr:EOG090X0BJA [Lynceus sp. MCZ IZ 141354]